MMRFTALSVLAILSFAACKSASTPQRVTLPHSVSTSLRSTATGRAYRIWVALPEGYNSRHAPYPVLYAADANAEFFTVVEAARLAALDREVPDLIVVGIGYDLPNGTIAESMGPRALDLTPTQDSVWAVSETKRAAADGYAAPEGSGGAADFLKFLQTDLAPTIERKYNADKNDRGWFGHSLGGLFGLYALFQGDGFFTRMLAGSPSLSWDRRMMFTAESTFANTHRALPAHLFISAGALETKMVLNMDEFVAQVRSHKYGGLTITVAHFADEAHDPVIPATISRGIRALYNK